MKYGWEGWQEEIIDNYILGYTEFENQEELANYIGKSLNAVKIKLSRRRKDIGEATRELTIEEYKIFLANRFTKTSEEIAEILNIPVNFLIGEIDEMDLLECKEFLLEDFSKREMTNDEYEIFIKLYVIRKKTEQQISHILNRSINFIMELIKNYESI